MSCPMPRWMLHLLLSLWLCLVPGLARSEESAPNAAVDPSFELGVGDVLRVEVVSQAEMSASLPVGADGAVDIPVAGRVRVLGYTLDSAKEQIEARLRDGYLVNPQVTLSVEKIVSKILKVTGGVVVPGEYPMTARRFPVSALIVRSGGLVDPSTPTAEVWRDVGGERQVLPINLVSLSKGEVIADLELLPGDTLVVPPAQQVCVDGNVQKPGCFVFHEGTTLSTAVATAGGANGTALLAKVKLIRGTEQYEVNLKRVLRGQEADIGLKPGDHVFVPESPF